MFKISYLSILFNAFIHPLVYTGLYSLERGNFSSCTRSTADCRHVSLTPLHSNSCSRCRVSTLRTHAIGATADDLPAQLHASYTANAKWQLAGPPSLLARNYKQTLSRMGIIDQRGRVDFYRRGMIARYPIMFLTSPRLIIWKIILCWIPNTLELNTLFFFFLICFLRQIKIKW